MSNGDQQRDDDFHIAEQRIAAEKEARTGRLDLLMLRGLTRLPESIRGLRWLRSLVCGGTQVTDLGPLAGLDALQSLYCTGIPVADLGPLAELDALQSLDCALTQVADLGPLARCKALQFLSCWNTQVGDLGPLVGLDALQSLDCSRTQVADLGPLAGHKALQSLTCSDTQVADLGPLAGLDALQYLYCWGTQVADLGPLARLDALQDLFCSNTQVADLSPLAGLDALQRLHCSNTPVADLGPLAGLERLKNLHLWKTRVDALPERIIELPRLEHLIIGAHPGLTDIPAEVLSQEGNDNCLPRLRAHLADLRFGAAPLRDLKVIVLGNGRVGKTQLCRRLRGEGFEPSADSTHGISVTSVELPLPGDEPSAALNLWDFGGQDLYHGTHALFMRTRAVFVVVWSPATELGAHEHAGQVFRNHPLPYWLEYVRHLGGEQSPVLLVQTRCDRGLGECMGLPMEQALLEPLLAGDRLVNRVTYSAKDQAGQASLMEALQRAVGQLRALQGCPRIGRNRLAVWDRLRAWRDVDAAETDPAQRQHRLLPFARFAALCAEQGIHSPATFAEVLHHAGMVFYGPHLFDDQLVLDQSWALDAVYAVFTRDGGVYATLRGLGGRFTRPLLDALLWRQRGLSVDDQRSLIGLMKTSGVCFEHRRARDPDETEYVAPDLLPEGADGPPAALAETLAARWEPIIGAPLEAALRLPFLSPSMGRAVLSDLGRLAGDTALYWRHGLCLYDAASRASAIVDALADADDPAAAGAGYGGRLRIRVKGADTERLLADLIERIGRLNDRGDWNGEWAQGSAGTGMTTEAPMPDEPVADHARRKPTARATGAEPDPCWLQPTDPPPSPPASAEVYVSFAWRQEHAEPLVDDLIAGLAKHGIRVLRDSDQLQPGDRISEFMRQLSAGRCVLLVLSDAYLRSPYCMTELHGIWVNARQRDAAFLKRIVPLVQPNASIGTVEERLAHAIHWKQRYDRLDALIREHGADLLAPRDFEQFKLIADYYRHVGEVLEYANDVLVPRDRPTLSSDNFAVIKGLIGRALG